MYDQGKGVAQSHEETIKWWQLAAAQRHAHAQWNLATMYAKGQGAARDMAKAMHWCKLAADQGQPCAQEMMLTQTGSDRDRAGSTHDTTARLCRLAGGDQGGGARAGQGELNGRVNSIKPGNLNLAP